MTRQARLPLAGLLAAAVLSTACPSGPPPAPAPAGPTDESAWTPSAGCPPVAVPDGDYPLLGDPRACKGGRIVLETNSYPTHFNYFGPERNYSISADYVEGFLNTLVQVHPITLQVIPELVTHWEEPEPGRVFIFHLDPDAKWSDGKPIVAADVLATWDLVMAPEVTEVFFKQEFDRFNKPVALDERTVRWEAQVASWRNLLVLADVFIHPAHATNPKTYLVDWRWKPPVTSGMYDLGRSEDGKFFEMVRRQDFWGEGKRQFIGLGNFDTIYRKAIFDNEIAWEHFKKGDIDYYLVTRAQRWVEETEFDKIKNGWIQKQKLLMRQPEVPSQMAMNLEHPLFKDPRVRRGLFWLMDREHLHDQIFYQQYTNKNSMFANSIYENPANEKVTFNPEKGLALLAEAGWTQKDKDGILIKDGKRFEFDFIYIHPAAERVYTPLQETYRKYGVKMNLKLVQPSAWIKVSQSKDFEMIYANWGPSPFPEPRALWHSEKAKIKDTSNVCRFADPRADALIEQYEQEFDLTRRAEICRELDALLYEQTPYLLDWYADNWRNLWWDRFGMPEWCAWPTIDIRHTLWQTWWADADRSARLDAAMAAGKALPRPPAENAVWKKP